MVWYSLQSVNWSFVCLIRQIGDIYNFCRTAASVIYIFGNTTASVLGANEAPENFYHAVKTYTSHRFNGRWMDRGGPKIGPLTSPDRNAVCICLWGHANNLV
jgi:hypothetical protein